MTMSEQAVLELTGVSRHYHQGNETVHALERVDLRFETGEFVAVAGPSGSGKTTLLNIAAGLDRPTAGTVCLDGRNLNELSSRQLAAMRLHKLGFIFQAYNLIPVLSARENAEFILLLQGVPSADRRRKVDALLREVGLAGMEDRRPAELSGGQQQRVAVARAMVAKPSLILADEPTANLDSDTAFALLELMAQLNREQGTTFIFSTHDPRVMNRARRVIRLHDGRVESDSGPLAEDPAEYA